MWWNRNVHSSYGKCIVLNEKSKLKPVNCDSKHSTLCSANNSLLVSTKFDGVPEDKKPTGGLCRNKGI